MALFWLPSILKPETKWNHGTFISSAIINSYKTHSIKPYLSHPKSILMHHLTPYSLHSKTPNYSLHPPQERPSPIPFPTPAPSGTGQACICNATLGGPGTGAVQLFEPLFGVFCGLFCLGTFARALCCGMRAAAGGLPAGGLLSCLLACWGEARRPAGSDVCRDVLCMYACVLMSCRGACLLACMHGCCVVILAALLLRWLPVAGR